MNEFSIPQSFKRNNPNELQHSIFFNELKTLMTGFGDNDHPDGETTGLLEEYVIEYIQNIAILAYKRSKRKGFNEIQLKDLLYIIKHDKKKYYRVPILLSFYATVKTTNKNMNQACLDKATMISHLTDLAEENF